MNKDMQKILKLNSAVMSMVSMYMISPHPLSAGETAAVGAAFTAVGTLSQAFQGADKEPDPDPETT